MEEEPIDKKAIRTMSQDILRIQKKMGKNKLEPTEVFELRAEKARQAKEEEERRTKIEEGLKEEEEQEMKTEEEELLKQRKDERLKEIENEKKREDQKKQEEQSKQEEKIREGQKKEEEKRRAEAIKEEEKRKIEEEKERKKQEAKPKTKTEAEPKEGEIKAIKPEQLREQLIKQGVENRKKALMSEKESLKDQRFNLGREYQDLIKTKEPLAAQKNNLLKQIEQIKKNFQAIIIKEKKIEEIEEEIEQRELIAKTPNEKRLIEKERWGVEEKRRELEKQRWPWDDKIKKIDDQINELEEQISQIELQEASLVNKQQEITKKEEKLTLEIERITSAEDLEIAENLMDKIDREKERIVQEINKISLNLNGVLSEEEEIEKKKKTIEQEEKAATQIDRRRELEKQRWQAGEERRKIENRRWEIEETKQNLENQLKRLDERKQNISAKRNSIIARAEEVVRKIEGRPAPEPKPEIKIEPLPVDSASVAAPAEEAVPLSGTKEGEPELLSKIEQAKKRIAAFKEKEPETEKSVPAPVSVPFVKTETEKEEQKSGEEKLKEKAELEEELKREQRRQEILERLQAPLGLEGDLRERLMPSNIKRSEVTLIVPQKLSFREKLWVRILIVTIVFILLTGVVSFWYWFFKVKSEPFVPESENEQGVAGEVVIPDPLFSVENIKVILISKTEEIPDLLSAALREDLSRGEFKRVVIKTKTKLITLKELFQSLQVDMPEEFYNKLEQYFTLYIYSQPQGNRLGFATKIIGDKKSLEELLKLEEPNLEYQFNSFFEMQGKSGPALVSYFKDGPEFRYQTLNTNDLGICYYISDDYFVFTSSWQSIEEVLKRLKENL